MAHGRFEGVDEAEGHRSSAVVWIMFLAGIAITTLVAIFAPDDVLARNPQLKAMVDAIAAVVLFIDIFAEISRFPEVARLVIATGWCLVPLQSAWALAARAYRLHDWGRFRDRPVFQTALFVLLLAAVVLPAIFWTGPEITARQLESTWRHRLDMADILRFAAGDRLLLGIISGTVTGLIAWILGFVLMWARHIPYIYLNADRPGA